MASSKKLPHRDLRSHVAGVLAKILKPRTHIALGLSGGVDSMALLDILQALSKKLRFKLSAVHVNHQLSPNAEEWAESCRRWCNARRIPIEIVKVKLSGVQRLGIEAAAREARYREYARQAADYMALAHQLDDQMETMFLQLLRGSGVKGLSAMPQMRFQDDREAPRIIRPLLDVPRSEIERYAKTRKLKWIEDESNENIGLDRNFLRHKVFPLIAQRFPAYRETLGRARQHFAEAACLLDELAETDFRNAVRRGRIKAAVLRKLAAARARNLLRYYFAQQGLLMPGAKKLEEILRQLAYSRADANVRVTLGDLEVRRYQGDVHIRRFRPAVGANLCVAWRGEKQLKISELDGVLTFTRTSGKDIDYAKLMQGSVTVRVRRGGEKLRPDCRRPRRSLKDLLQEAQIAPWRRFRLPLLFCGEHLVYVPGIGVDCEYQARAGCKGLSVKWNANDNEGHAKSAARSPGAV